MDPPVSASATPGPLVEVVLRERALFEEVCEHTARLHGVAIKLLDHQGRRLVEVAGETSLCQYVYERPPCRQACLAIVRDVRVALPQPHTVEPHYCFSGAEYRVAPVHHETGVVGKVVLGPFCPPSVEHTPDAFVGMDPNVDPAVAWTKIRRFPRIDASLAERLAVNLATVIEVLLFMSLKSQMTTDMHVESIREAYAELREKHRDLEATARSLRRLDRGRSDIVSTVGRTLKKPLTNIIAHAEMLAQGVTGDLSEDQRAFLETIIESGETLLALAGTLEELSQVERGELVLVLAPVHVEELVESVARQARRTADPKNVQILVAGGHADIPPLRLDPERVRTALEHLVDNAIKFTPAGGQVTLMARLETAPAADGSPAEKLVIEVHDTGIGIQPDVLDRLFDAFYTVRGPAHPSSGLGLGLTLAAAYARAHGGQIVVDSAPEIGSCFYLSLPSNLATPA